MLICLWEQQVKFTSPGKVLILLAAFALFESAVSAQETPAQSLMREGDEAWDGGDYEKAEERYREVVALEGEAPGGFEARYNLASLAYRAGDYQSCATWFTSLTKLDGARYHRRLSERMFICLEKIGDREALAAERARFLTLWRELTEAQREGDQAFLRDRFSAGGHDVIASEFFEPNGEFLRRYHFLVVASDVEEITELAQMRAVSVGAYEATSAVTRELEGRPDDWRLWHLDGYDCDRHQTLAFFDEEPDYPVAKNLVRSFLEGRLESRSSSEIPGECPFAGYILPPNNPAAIGQQAQ